MMDISQAIALAAFLFPLAYSPGPGNLFFAATGARFGFQRTLAPSAGYHIATWFVTAAIGFGFAGLLAKDARLGTAIQLAGAVYILWLAFGFLRSGLTADTPEPRPAGAVTGAVLLLFNPKAYVIIGLMFSQFLDGTQGDAKHVLAITTLFTLNNFLAFSLYSIAGARLGALLRVPKATRQMNTGFGVMLIGVGVWFLTGRIGG
jgi:threonine/homoserine/homoserine lactone efflux protein